MLAWSTFFRQLSSMHAAGGCIAGFRRAIFCPNLKFPIRGFSNQYRNQKLCGCCCFHCDSQVFQCGFAIRGMVCPARPFRMFWHHDSVNDLHGLGVDLLRECSHDAVYIAALCPSPVCLADLHGVVCGRAICLFCVVCMVYFQWLHWLVGIVCLTFVYLVGSLLRGGRD